MPHLVEIAFKGNRKDFFTWDGAEPPSPSHAVIVEADRGEDLGRVHAVGELAEKRCGGCAHGCGTQAPQRRMLRVATPAEVRRSTEMRGQDDEARRKAMERVKAHGLVMKVSDAEWQWDRNKLTLYFTAERRVDFRALVRDLASAFRTRIELKQIGVRDEAKRLDGIGRCGRQYCSSSWLPELRPVNLQVAKDQGLSLNPSQISGACGRLMCCLRYEHEFYVQSRKRFPKEGKILLTSKGEEKVIANDIFNDRVTLRTVEGDTRVVPLADLKREIEERHNAPIAVEDAEEEASSATGEEGALPADDVLAPERRELGASSSSEAPSDAPRESSDESRDALRTRRRGRRGGRRNRPDAEAPRDDATGNGAAGNDAARDDAAGNDAAGNGAAGNDAAGNDAAGEGA